MNYKVSISGPEKEIYNLLNMLSIEDNASILYSLASDLSADQKNFYTNEAWFWKALGQKYVLIQDILDLIPSDLLLEHVDAIAEDILDKHTAKPRYQPETRYWSPETKGPRRPQTVLTQEPGLPEVTPEESRIRPHPEKEYLDPNLFKTEWRPGPPPPLPEEMPDFSSMNKEDRAKLYRALKEDIATELRGYALGSKETDPVTPPVPAPFVRDMVLAYLDAVRPEFAMQLRDAGYGSITRHGFALPKSMAYLTRYMSIEDLYIYWNSIVNHKVLPWTNIDFTLAKYSGSEEGKNLPELYNAWKGQVPSEETTIPEGAIDYWKEDVKAPAWFNNVVGPIDYVKRLPPPVKPEIMIEEPVEEGIEEPTIETAPKTKPLPKLAPETIPEEPEEKIIIEEPINAKNRNSKR